MSESVFTTAAEGAIVGYGLIRPFQRDRKANFAAAGGEALIRSAVGRVLGTRGCTESTTGELPWRPELGSRLDLLRHQKNDVLLQELGRTYVVDALKRWEPRVRVTSVRVTRDQHDAERVLAIRVRYDIVSSPTGGLLARNIGQTVQV